MKYNIYNYFITSINEKQLLKLKSIKCYRLVTDMNKSIIEPSLFLIERYQVRNFNIYFFGNFVHKTANINQLG